MAAVMASGVIKYLNPWKAKRDRIAAELAALRARGGDNCARCRRPLRFDLPAGHDQAAKIDPIGLDCLTHGRCNVQGRDMTEEVMERLRPSREADLFAKGRKGKKKAA